MTLDYALKIARLWKAGKLIGADADEVIESLLAGYDALAAESEARHQSCLTLMASVTQYRAHFDALEAALREIADKTDDFRQTNR